MTVPVANRHAAQVEIGPGLLYIAAIGTTEPTGLTDADWGSSWTELGYTDKGNVFTIAPTVDDIMVAEEIFPVEQIVSKSKATLTVEMAQVTAWNLGVAMGGGTIHTSSGVTTFEPPAAGTEQEVMLGWRSVAQDEAMLWRRCKPDGSLKLERASTTTKALIPGAWSILIPTTANLAPWKWFGADPAKTGADLAVVFPGGSALPPVLVMINPDFGAAAGGTPVILHGTGFTGATGVEFGSTAASSVVVVDDGRITCTSPAHATGTVDVTVQHALGNAVLHNAFTFI